MSRGKRLSSEQAVAGLPDADEAWMHGCDGFVQLSRGGVAERGPIRGQE